MSTGRACRSSRPAPVVADTGSTGASQAGRGEQRPDLASTSRPAPGRPVRLGHDGDAVADPERIEQRQVLERLRARAVVGGHDEERGVDLAGPDEHVADEAVVTRHVDEVERRRRVEARCA